MSDMPCFVAWVNGWIKEHDPVQAEIARHEMSATVHRHATTRSDSGVSSMNTLQLAWCVLSGADKPNFIEHPFFVGFLTSAILDGDLRPLEQALACAVVPQAMAWVSWAREFAGNDEALAGRLAGLKQLRELAGAVSLAAMANPALIAPRILDMLCKPTLALVYLRVLDVALQGDRAAELAVHAVKQLVAEPEVLFAGRVDRIVASLIPHIPNARLEELITPLLPAAGEACLVALAENHLRAGRAEVALGMVKDLRYLSPHLPHGALIATLSALELRRWDEARNYAGHIEDEPTRMRVGVRLAQAANDTATELRLLASLHEAEPQEADTFVQLLNALERSGQSEALRELCAARRETFAHDRMVSRFIDLHLAKA